jgi:hypothetical protein
VAEPLTVKEVHAMLEQELRNRSDLGLWNAVSKLVLDPKNPFEPEPIRKPRRWFVFFLISGMAAIAAFSYFNIWN